MNLEMEYLAHHCYLPLTLIIIARVIQLWNALSPEAIKAPSVNVKCFKRIADAFQLLWLTMIGYIIMPFKDSYLF